MDFGKRLRALRRARNLTQRDLADRVGVSFTYLSKLENERMERPPSEDLLRRLAAELETDPDDLVLLARRVPKDIEDMVVRRPESVDLLRSMDRLSREEWAEMIQEARRRGRRA